MPYIVRWERLGSGGVGEDGGGGEGTGEVKAAGERAGEEKGEAR